MVLRQAHNVWERENQVPSPAVARAVTVLESLAAEPKTLSDLSRKLRIPKSSLHGIVTTLVAHGWIVAGDGGRLVLGDRLFEVGVLYGRNHRLIRAFCEVAPHAVEQTGETTFLGVLTGRDVEHLARVDGTQRLRFVVHEGDRVPAHATALGKAILAHRPPGELITIFGSELLPPMTLRTVTGLADLKEQLALVREQGYALDLGEVDEDLHCVAAPVWDATKTTVASVAIAAPASRHSSRLTTYADIVCDIALTISRRLGYQPDELAAATSSIPEDRRLDSMSRRRA